MRRLSILLFATISSIGSLALAKSPDLPDLVPPSNESLPLTGRWYRSVASGFITAHVVYEFTENRLVMSANCHDGATGRRAELVVHSPITITETEFFVERTWRQDAGFCSVNLPRGRLGYSIEGNQLLTLAADGSVLWDLTRMR